MILTLTQAFREYRIHLKKQNSTEQPNVNVKKL